MRAAAWPPYGPPPLRRGTGAINRAPTHARYGRLGTRAGGGAATLLLHSGGGGTLGAGGGRRDARPAGVGARLIAPWAS